jgi:hypothetical protein
MDNAVRWNRRGTGGRFRKGVSGNVGGRPRGLMPYLQGETRDGRTIADFMLEIMRDPNRQLDQRMEAATWLADSAFGKPAQVMEHGGDPGNRVPVVLTWGDVEGRHGRGH